MPRKPEPVIPAKLSATALKEPELALPAIPNYLKDPTIFEDKHLGIVMVADWGVRPELEGNIPEQNYWLFRLHDDHWCSEREATSADMMTVKSLIFLAKTDANPERFKHD